MPFINPKTRGGRGWRISVASLVYRVSSMTARDTHTQKNNNNNNNKKIKFSGLGSSVAEDLPVLFRT